MPIGLGLWVVGGGGWVVGRRAGRAVRRRWESSRRVQVGQV